jgi:hypothetical protein
MVNTKTMGHVFRHPKYYEELKRIRKQEASSVKQQAEASSAKQQASSTKRQAPSLDKKSSI